MSWDTDATRDPQGVGGRASLEERALYRAILAAPYDDAPRLVYADWLDEHADRFPPVVSRGERGRAELIRLQCEFARLSSAGWRAGPRPAAPTLEKRERRLNFRHGRKWRGAFPFRTSSAPFDRGFLRPYRALRPQVLLGQLPAPDPLWPFTHPFPPLPADSPARRYVPDGDPLAVCPLWDVHLFASGWHWDSLADEGQYGPLLQETAGSPALERVGWLKVSFLRTPVFDFLRTGNFANVETLVLNAGPFPEVLDAVAENESFRSLRYVQFGAEHTEWADGDARAHRYVAISDKLSAANAKHLPFGEMRAVLRTILRDTPVLPALAPAFTFSPALFSLQFPAPAPPPDPAARARGVGTVWYAVLFLLFIVASVDRTRKEKVPPPQSPHVHEFKVPDLKRLEYKPGQFEAELRTKRTDELEEMLKKLREGHPPGAFEPRPGRPVAPPPRPVERADEK